MTRTSAVQSVVDILRTEIPQSYQPGDLLQNERLIAERLGVSRNTVREALIHLEAFGIIEKTQRGPRICAPNIGAVFHIMDQYFDRSLKTCLDLLDFRRMIDIGALPQVVERITDNDIALLERHVGQVERALTAHEDALADYAFHNEIIRISGNSVLEKLYKVLSHTLVFYMEIGKSNPVNRDKTISDHRAIIRALGARSLDAAIRAFSQHYDYSERSVRAAYEKAAPQKREMENL
ncbi:FCD domain-containing protein [Mesorhizobium sp. BAC0120]|uniref:FadR/GntR family transcriptional regulator n=1 Tax=Mesorhizobium sp. BAC0120 TaxID=3090670 RepID=UPI00298D02FF|nr:FCD domain-containing protein [Mesorhizobium sp. BAC0120]MDW6020759.1 FCD domain-containing protein [Mesorhizobium sp. BAC0120]